MLDKEIECLLYHGAGANYWSYRVNDEYKDWLFKLQEFLGYQSIRGYEEYRSNEKVGCTELIFSKYSFTFKFTSNFITKDEDRYANLYVLFNDEEVISFTL